MIHTIETTKARGERSGGAVNATRDFTRALINMLEDFQADRRQMYLTQRAILNIMDDLGDERGRFELTQRALLNILDDFRDERSLFQNGQKAALNILEDFAAERERLERTQRAILNILDDFDEERIKVEGANKRLQREIEDRITVEKALTEKGHALARSNAELEQFAYIASHDLQAPLRTISSFVEILGDTVLRNSEGTVARQFGYIVEGVARMQNLIKALLEYSRVGRELSPFRRLSCDDVCADVLRDMRALLNEAGAVVHCEPLPTIVGDYTSLRQVFQNLIGNAIKFRGAAPPVVKISAKRYDQGWELRVQDNGIGIDPNLTHRLFVIFQRLQTRSLYPGTGIGLAVCKKIVGFHGGTIWVEANGSGNGTVFAFTLPDQGERDPP